MYLEPRPKEDIDSLYDRENEQAKLREYVENKSPLILITGFRRVGKTSLLKTVLKTYSDYNIIIDLRNLGSQSYIKKKDVANLFQSSIQSFLDEHQSAKERITTLFRSVRGVTFPGGAGVQLDFSMHEELDLSELFKKLDQWASENKTTIVVAVDEAQEFRKSKHIDMASIFAAVYDNCRNIVLILTGSEIGVLYDFLDFENANSPLFGRITKEIEINPLSREQSIEFLTMGLEQHKIKKIDQDVLAEVVDELGGIVGWLNQFGMICVENKRVDKKFIKDAKNIGSKLARAEFNKFLKGRVAADKYNSIMKNLSIKPLSWTHLKKIVQVDLEEEFYDANFSSLLDTLSKSGFIQESEKLYSIIDPLLKFSFEND